MIAEISASVLVSEIADGLRAIGHNSGFASALLFPGEATIGSGGATADTHPAKAKASNAPDPLNRIQSTPEFIVNVIKAG
jgi:hypothetical protein